MTLMGMRPLVKQAVDSLMGSVVLEVSQIFLKTFLAILVEGSRKQQQRGQDLKYEVDIDLREAYMG